MSSSPSTAKASPGPAPWRAPFLKNVTDMASPEFNLATIHSSSSSSASSSLTPRLRTVIFRGLWASLLVNPKNTADLNPPLYESDLLTLTTDARMAKVPDFLTSDGGKDDTKKSGGGGPVEACFWTDAKVQWRIRGEAFLLGPDIDGSNTAALREHLLARMRNDWSFAREVTAHFGNLSPMMRGTFKNPVPGTSRAANPPSDTLKLGQKVEDLDDKVARENFRVVVIVPTEVDQTDLSASEDPRRYLYRFRVNGWEKIELWP
ncbi:pyridoxamine 5'-phosphate oxidase-domain-containing protein [Colletotrichum acutatum]|uniref:Pyridoxamine 5'-phosphate oxidase-domain-containing protein n=1 Tax=Glomerella acutata TaxID=27357 RepID=A0AAD8UQ84_GLOAC|nr:pyridoxamine 5'-phosphate oxidase-domain-containing protein [Colletotrichum acutatum]KAK1725914.1 pyridoxamine 5'-phosphate oxidase-domain-containing protein [Colletotrichum acutatum]